MGTNLLGYGSRLVYFLRSSAWAFLWNILWFHPGLVHVRGASGKKALTKVSRPICIETGNPGQGFFTARCTLHTAESQLDPDPTRESLK